MLSRNCCLFVFFLALVGCNDEAGEFGRFEGDVKTEWLDVDQRSMRLLEDFHYIDPDNDRWTAPAGDIIDGASIPRGLWTIVGAPFDGLYRKASVIHDVGCVRRTRSMDDTHRAFYYACRLGGVSEAKALLMYWAVSQFAEPWPDPGTTTVESTLVMQASLMPSDSAFAAAARYFESYADSLSGTDPDHRRQLRELRQLRPAELERRIVRDVRRNRYTIPQRLDAEDLRLERLPHGFTQPRRLLDSNRSAVDINRDQFDIDHGQIEQRQIEQRRIDGQMPPAPNP